MTAPGEPPGPPPEDRKPFRWQRLVHDSDEPLFVLNARRQVLYVNTAWQTWAGLTPAEVRRQVCRPMRAAAAGDRLKALLALMAPTSEVLAGQPAQVGRREPASAAWCQVHFFPWLRGGRIQAILGRIRPASTPVAATVAAPLPERILQLRDQANELYRLDLLESDVPAVERLATQTRLAAGTALPVLLEGPDGSGKEWLARTIHLAGPRRNEFFTCIDLARVPTSSVSDLLFTRSERPRFGAVLLRHLARLPAELQTRLAERLEEGTLAPRLFASGRGDSDWQKLDPALYARLSALTLRVPSLAERRADWARLLPHFLARAALAVGAPVRSLSPEADDLLRVHEWPGNFRELLAVLRDAHRRATSERIALADLPLYLRSRPAEPLPQLPLDALLETIERRLIELALRESHANKSKAAEFLSIWRARLLRRMEQFGISDPEPPAEGTAHA